jgi:hypothetical protein
MGFDGGLTSAGQSRYWFSVAKTYRRDGGPKAGHAQGRGPTLTRCEIGLNHHRNLGECLNCARWPADAPLVMLRLKLIALPTQTFFRFNRTSSVTYER